MIIRALSSAPFSLFLSVTLSSHFKGITTYNLIITQIGKKLHICSKTLLTSLFYCETYFILKSVNFCNKYSKLFVVKLTPLMLLYREAWAHSPFLPINWISVERRTDGLCKRDDDVMTGSVQRETTDHPDDPVHPDLQLHLWLWSAGGRDRNRLSYSV